MTTWYKVTTGLRAFCPRVEEVTVHRSTKGQIWCEEFAGHGNPPEVRKRKIHTEYEHHFPTRKGALLVLRASARARIEGAEKEITAMRQFLDSIQDEVDNINE